MEIETKRLILRPFRDSDWKDIVGGINDIRVSKNLLVVPFPYTKKDAVSWIKFCKKAWKIKKKTSYHFGIELKSEKKIIGGTDLVNVDLFTRKARTGSWLAYDYHRRGIMTEAKVAIFDFAFNTLKLDRLATDVFDFNKASNDMMKSLGYSHEGILKRARRSKATGKFHDEHLYALFKKDWKKIRSKIVKKIKKK